MLNSFVYKSILSVCSEIVSDICPHRSMTSLTEKDLEQLKEVLQQAKSIKSVTKSTAADFSLQCLDVANDDQVVPCFHGSSEANAEANSDQVVPSIEVSPPEIVKPSAPKAVRRPEKSIADKLPKYVPLETIIDFEQHIRHELRDPNQTVHNRDLLITKSLGFLKNPEELPEANRGSFKVGDLVWAKCSGYPYWPAMVCIDPRESNVNFNYLRHFPQTNRNPINFFHVQYLGDKQYVGWSNGSSIKKFNGWRIFHDTLVDELKLMAPKHKNQQIQASLVKQKDMDSWRLSIAMAEEAMGWSNEERIMKLTYHITPFQMIKVEQSQKKPAYLPKKRKLKREVRD